MDVVFIFTSSAFFIWAIRNVVAWGALWQEKDYNWRRLLLHLKETASGKNILFSPISLVKWIAFIFYFYTIFDDRSTTLFHLVIITVYITQGFFIMKDLLQARIRRPEFNPVVTVVIILSLIAISFIFSIPLLDKYFWIIFLDRITILIVSFFVFAISFPVEIYQDKEVENAFNKIKSHKDLMTIGIVGSYGKSSTKEFLFQLLSKNYKVLKTKGHQNSILEIARTINKYLKKSTQIFIVEMNDFDKGDIKKITELVKPNIGIITGVNPQYLSLFKSIDESINSKKELIDVLPKRSLILFNGSDKKIRDLYDRDKKAKKLYIVASDHESTDNKIIRTENRKITKDQIAFDALIGSKKIKISSPLIGMQNIENLLPAIYIADYMGMKDSEIKKAASVLRPPDNTMIIKINESGVIYIDDSSSTNPESVFAALEYMKLYKKKKYVVMQTMIELGKEAITVHTNIAQKIAEQCDILFVTNKDYLKHIQKVIKQSNKKCTVLHISGLEISKYINENTGKGDIILFEGYEARQVLDRLI